MEKVEVAHNCTFAKSAKSLFIWQTMVEAITIYRISAIFIMHLGDWIYAAIFIFASLLKRGQLLTERICSLRSEFFPVKRRPCLEFIVQGDKHEVTKVAPLQTGSSNFEQSSLN